MIYLINSAIIIIAILLAIETYNEKKAVFASIVLIMLGFISYANEIYSSGCKLPFNKNILYAIDGCIDYESITMFVAQTLIIAGSTVLLVRYILTKKHNKSLSADSRQKTPRAR